MTPYSQNSASGNNGICARALRLLAALLRQPGEAFRQMREPGALPACALLYCAGLLVSAVFYGQLSQAQGLSNPVRTTYLYRLAVEAGWGVFFNASWFSFMTLLATAAALPTALLMPLAAALPAVLAALAFITGPVTAAGFASGLMAGWLFFARRSKRFEMKAPLCLIIAVSALSPLAEAAAAAANAAGCQSCATGIQLLFGLWFLYLIIRGLRFIYGINAPKAFLLATLPLLASYVTLFSIYKAGLLSQAGLEVLTGF